MRTIRVDMYVRVCVRVQGGAAQEERRRAAARLQKKECGEELRRRAAAKEVCGEEDCECGEMPDTAH